MQQRRDSQSRHSLSWFRPVFNRMTRIAKSWPSWLDGSSTSTPLRIADRPSSHVVVACRSMLADLAVASFFFSYSLYSYGLYSDGAGSAVTLFAKVHSWQNVKENKLGVTRDPMICVWVKLTDWLTDCRWVHVGVLWWASFCMLVGWCRRYKVTVYIVMAYIFMAYTVMSFSMYGLCRCGLYSYGLYAR